MKAKTVNLAVAIAGGLAVFYALVLDNVSLTAPISRDYETILIESVVAAVIAAGCIAWIFTRGGRWRWYAFLAAPVAFVLSDAGVRLLAIVL